MAPVSLMARIRNSAGWFIRANTIRKSDAIRKWRPLRCRSFHRFRRKLKVIMDFITHCYRRVSVAWREWLALFGIFGIMIENVARRNQDDKLCFGCGTVFYGFFDTPKRNYLLRSTKSTFHVFNF